MSMTAKAVRDFLVSICRQFDITNADVDDTGQILIKTGLYKHSDGSISEEAE